MDHFSTCGNLVNTECAKKKTFNCLISCKLKTTVLPRSVSIFSKSSYFRKTIQNRLKVRRALDDANFSKNISI